MHTLNLNLHSKERRKFDLDDMIGEADDIFECTLINKSLVNCGSHEDIEFTGIIYILELM